MTPRRDLVIQALLDPESLASLRPVEWDLLVRQARRANLLGRLALLLDERGLAESIYPAARPHFASGAAMARRQDIAIRWEVQCIREALDRAGVPLVLLKGAAYVMAGLPVARGRMFSDVDVIVPKPALPEVESALMIHGWRSSHHSAYDQRYYRTWMHEIPPMQHVRRGTVIDVHHAILPGTARIKADSAAMVAAAIPAAGEERVFTFAPHDMVLHSATHLFHEGEFNNGLRDLADLDGLLRHFGREPSFWAGLVPRARDLGLSRPLYYALRYAGLLLETPVPAEVVAEARAGEPPGPLRPLLDFCFSRALRPAHASCADTWTPLARKLLYVRSHWLRMPFPLLAVHLARKAFISDPTPATEANAQ
jgi:hypothetical protein